MAAVFLPRAVRVGAGAVGELPAAMAQLGLSRPAIFTDPYFAGNGLLGRLLDILGEAGISARAFGDVVPDPTVASVDAAVSFLSEGQHDCVIGLGGGSSIDTAKATAVLSVHGGTVRDLKVPRQVDTLGLPVIAIPTTSGSGSEATRYTVVTDPDNDEKMLCAGLAFLPVLSVVDYELTLTKPRRLTADTGLDALTHAIEGYVSRRANPFTDAMALAAMRAIWPNLGRACDDPGDLAARESLMLGSLQAGIVVSNASVGLVHGMSRPIGAHFHVTHGLSNAMLLPLVTEWSAPAALARYAECARAMGIASAEEDDEAAVERLVAALKEMNRALDVPGPRRFGIDEAAWTGLIPLMAEQALASGSPANNPRIPDAAEIEALYREVWN